MDVFEKFLKDHNSAKKMGFYWTDPLQIIEQINLELAEVKIELAGNNKQALQDELGDVLHACLNLIDFCELDPLQTLERAVEKIGKRFTTMREMIAEENIENFANLPRAVKMQYWDKVKQQLHNINC
jgi:uncharacterized protein YabN with tetrapyrrole methylase and pyrophosphatase domain